MGAESSSGEASSDAPQSEISSWKGGVINVGALEQLLSAARRFEAQVLSFSEINQTVIPELEKSKTRRPRHFRSLVSNLTAEEKKIFAKAVEDFGDRFISSFNAWREAQTKFPTSGTFQFSFTCDSPAVGKAVQRYLEDLRRRIEGEPKAILLRKSLLVSAVSAFEVFFGSLARFIFAINKSALDDSEHSFTLQQLSNFTQLEDAREYLIERKLSSLIRDSIEVWDKWLKKASSGVSMESIFRDWDLVREAIARRNLVVHTNGKSNQIYVDIVRKIPSQSEGIPSVGSNLVVTEAYLDSILQGFLALGDILTVQVALKLKKHESEQVEDFLMRQLDELYIRESWKALRLLSEFALKLSLNREKRSLAQTFNWIARKRELGLADIEVEVRAWDTSGLAPRIAHVKSVLLDDFKVAKGEVRDLIASGELTEYEVSVEPLYEELRPELRDGAAGAEVEKRGGRSAE
ncbi:hypothetical protein [Streptomyces sp. NPDC056512]|uniref:hypothetical protein n=1 Tax=Streptomyces sp. NPDC056512 TaxID=3345846 RepID=UPI00367DC7B1